MVATRRGAKTGSVDENLNGDSSQSLRRQPSRRVAANVDTTKENTTAVVGSQSNSRQKQTAKKDDGTASKTAIALRDMIENDDQPTTTSGSMRRSRRIKRHEEIETPNISVALIPSMKRQTRSATQASTQEEMLVETSDVDGGKKHKVSTRKTESRAKKGDNNMDIEMEVPPTRQTRKTTRKAILPSTEKQQSTNSMHDEEGLHTGTPIKQTMSKKVPTPTSVLSMSSRLTTPPDSPMFEFIQPMSYAEDKIDAQENMEESNDEPENEMEYIQSEDELAGPKTPIRRKGKMDTGITRYSATKSPTPDKSTRDMGVNAHQAYESIKTSHHDLIEESVVLDELSFLHSTPPGSSKILIEATIPQTTNAQEQTSGDELLVAETLEMIHNDTPTMNDESIVLEDQSAGSSPSSNHSVIRTQIDESEEEGIEDDLDDYTRLSFTTKTPRPQTIHWENIQANTVVRRNLAMPISPQLDESQVGIMSGTNLSSPTKRQIATEVIQDEIEAGDETIEFTEFVEMPVVGDIGSPGLYQKENDAKDIRQSVSEESSSQHASKDKDTPSTEVSKWQDLASPAVEIVKQSSALQNHASEEVRETKQSSQGQSYASPSYEDKERSAGRQNHASASDEDMTQSSEGQTYTSASVEDIAGSSEGQNHRSQYAENITKSSEGQKIPPPSQSIQSAHIQITNMSTSASPILSAHDTVGITVNHSAKDADTLEHALAVARPHNNHSNILTNAVDPADTQQSTSQHQSEHPVQEVERELPHYMKPTLAYDARRKSLPSKAMQTPVKSTARPNTSDGASIWRIARPFDEPWWAKANRTTKPPVSADHTPIPAATATVSPIRTQRSTAPFTSSTGNSLHTPRLRRQQAPQHANTIAVPSRFHSTMSKNNLNTTTPLRKLAHTNTITPIQNRPARTPLRTLMGATTMTPHPTMPLRGVVAIVEVYTAEGASASAPFVTLLHRLGAKTTKIWSQDRVTHVVFKDGSPTITQRVFLHNKRVEETGNGTRIYCVNSRWVSDCDSQSRLVPELDDIYAVSTGDMTFSGRRKRKSMEPSTILNIDGSLVKQRKNSWGRSVSGRLLDSPARSSSDGKENGDSPVTPVWISAPDKLIQSTAPQKRIRRLKGDDSLKARRRSFWTHD